MPTQRELQEAVFWASQFWWHEYQNETDSTSKEACFRIWKEYSDMHTALEPVDQ
jgi:hypothetical protein